MCSACRVPPTRASPTCSWCGRSLQPRGMRGWWWWRRAAVLCCAVLCCAVLCCAVLCCAVLCCAVLCCAVLFLCSPHRIMNLDMAGHSPMPPPPHPCVPPRTPMPATHRRYLHPTLSRGTSSGPPAPTSWTSTQRTRGAWTRLGRWGHARAPRAAATPDVRCALQAAMLTAFPAPPLALTVQTLGSMVNPVLENPSVLKVRSARGRVCGTGPGRVGPNLGWLPKDTWLRLIGTGRAVDAARTSVSGPAAGMRASAAQWALGV